MARTTVAALFAALALMGNGCTGGPSETGGAHQDAGASDASHDTADGSGLDASAATDATSDAAGTPQADASTSCLDCDATVLACGDGRCDPGEDCVFCPRDCGSCDVHWVSENAGATNTLEGVSFPRSAMAGYAVGPGGRVLATDDRGASWTALDVGVTADLHGVTFVDELVGYVVGDDGVVLRTIDSGASWTTQATSVAGALRAVHFINAALGVAVGEAGTVIRTVDAGATWQVRSSGTTRTLRAVQLVDRQLGYAVGDAGTILQTTDAGATWKAQASGTTADLYALAFVDAQTGYATGAGGVILKTVDGGGHWRALSSGVITILRAAVFPLGAAHGYVVGDGGVILRTSDAGASWQREDGQTTANLRAVAFPAHWAVGFAVGDGATIIERQPVWDAAMVYDLELPGPVALTLLPGGSAANAVLYAGTSEGYVFSVSVSERLARYRPTLLDDAVVGRAPVSTLAGETDQTVVVSTAGGFGYTIDGQTGVTRWQTDGDQSRPGLQPLGDALVASPIVARQRGITFFATHNLGDRQNRLFAFDAQSGACLWVFNGDCNGGTGTLGLGQVSGAPIRHPVSEQLFMTSASLGGGPTVWALDTSVDGAGAVSWTLSLGSIDASPAFVDVDGQSIFVGTTAGAIHRLRASDGHSCWSTEGSGCDDAAGDDEVFCTATDALATSCDGGSSVTSDLSSMLTGTYAGRLVFATGDQHVRMIDGDGHLIWKTAALIPGPSFPVPLPDKGRIYLGSSDGKVHELDFATGAETASVVVGDGDAQVGAPVYDGQSSQLFVATTKGRIYRYAVPF